ncbi:MAG: phosphoribosylglycinamide formyltransferase [Candidatus Nitronauta litoralis]|uniref:Phosphoribosylglycinamide formyltransferase n=1 Tax=Candidatus Nitronauta litoralis TaxID=2705533 RepID=A0A7T0BXE3_9BACT|nr:MAG: phosphoribosylglycinamide formyltransferase [Candidatus Nitronauta litoralis]
MPTSTFKIAVLVSGRGTNLQSILDQVESGSLPVEVALIISNKKNAQALERGRKAGIPSKFINPKDYPDRDAYDAVLVKLLQAENVDLICLAGYMRILTSKFIQAFSGKIINIHPSLLPSFPGLDVQQQAIDHGVKYSGCTVHFVDEEVDTGPIILQAVVPVKEQDTAETLSARILKEEHKIYPEAVRLIAENRICVEGRRVSIQEPSL